MEQMIVNDEKHKMDFFSLCDAFIYIYESLNPIEKKKKQRSKAKRKSKPTKTKRNKKQKIQYDMRCNKEFCFVLSCVYVIFIMKFTCIRSVFSSSSSSSLNLISIMTLI